MEALDIVEINEIMTPGEINEIMTPGIRVGHHNAHRVLPPGKRLALDIFLHRPECLNSARKTSPSVQSAAPPFLVKIWLH
jgi:hypothetical protein